MKVTALSIPDVFLIEPKVYEDNRGFFFESFNQADFKKETNFSPTFVQENHSRSIKGVLRGLHYQLPPRAQDKLLRVVNGEIFDVVVDIRKGSSTFGK
jgi:dTDP-4-dehydrorhamnose 3,5-epimerase